MSARRVPEKRCSFCGKARSAVKALVQGGDRIRICNECVRACDSAIGEGARIQAAANDAPLTIADGAIYLDQHARVLRAISASDARHVEELAESLRRIAKDMTPPPETVHALSELRPPVEGQP